MLRFACCALPCAFLLSAVPAPARRYLSAQHDATTIGVMLGLTASRLGSSDALTSRMLFLHLPATHPASFPELEVTPIVQVNGMHGLHAPS